MSLSIDSCAGDLLPGDVCVERLRCVNPVTSGRHLGVLDMMTPQLSYELNGGARVPPGLGCRKCQISLSCIVSQNQLLVSVELERFGFQTIRCGIEIHVPEVLLLFIAGALHCDLLASS